MSAGSKSRFCSIGLIVLSNFGCSLQAQPIPDEERDNSVSVPRAYGKGSNMDYGPFLSYTINCKTMVTKGSDNLALKGIAIKVGGQDQATVCFDTELILDAAGWIGGVLESSKTHLTSYKGSQEAFVDGTLQFSTKPIPGWSRGDDFTDPRPLHAGPLPADWAKFKGLYRHGDDVILNYTVGGVEIF